MKKRFFSYAYLFLTLQAMEYPTEKSPAAGYYTPWREAYQRQMTEAVTAGKTLYSGCPFCEQIKSGEDEKYFIFYRGPCSFAMLSTNPYTDKGHFLVLPYQHTSLVEKLTHTEVVDVYTTLTKCITVLERIAPPDGVNCIGQFSSNCASVPQHIHWQGIPHFNRTYPELCRHIHTSDSTLDLVPIYKQFKEKFDNLNYR